MRVIDLAVLFLVLWLFIGLAVNYSARRRR